MSTGQSIGERLQIVREIFLVVSHHASILQADGPKLDCFYLVSAILDDNSYRCTTRQRLFSVLRRSPVWSRVLPFLVYADSTCARKGCHHHEGHHNGPMENCTCSNYHWSSTVGGSTTTPCLCSGYIPKDFK